MTVKRSSQKGGDSYYDFLDYMADCVIHLDQRVQEQITTRRLRVLKYRGSSYGRNEYPFGITPQGVWIIPVTQASLQQKALGESLPTGIQGMNELMGGGYRHGSCTLFSGGSGTGKTTFVCSFVEHITSIGEKVLYIDFEESWDALISCMKSPGVELETARASGLLKFLSIMPEAQGVEEHLIQAFMAIRDFQPDHLVVDAISACRRMGSIHSAFDYMLRLINHCKQRGITSLLTNLASTRDYGSEISGMDLSSVIDTAIILRNEESGGEYVREMGILKSRGRNHSSAIHPFLITDTGVKVQGGALR
jgi:circadian clock protein KaiC